MDRQPDGLIAPLLSPAARDKMAREIVERIFDELPLATDKPTEVRVRVGEIALLQKLWERD